MVVVDFGPQPIWCCTCCRAFFRKPTRYCPVDGAEVTQAVTDPLIGEHLDHYVVEVFLGEGGMGRVYRARHKALPGREYAVKILSGDLITSPEARTRFAREAKNASVLSHPNIVGVIDAGESAEGLLYIVMELVEGRSLAALIEQGPLDPARVAALMADVSEGLAHAHEHTIVHRDLKPDNVMVEIGPDGERARIADFGIAVSVDSNDERVTQTGMAIGTPIYLSPEQAASNGREDHRSDQYAAGVTMFEALTGGRVPFHGLTMELLVAKMSRAAPPIASVMPEGHTVPARLAKIVDRMLEREPAARFSSMAEVAHLLRTWNAPAPTERIPRRSTRRLGVGVLTAVAVLAALAAWQLRDRSRTVAPSAPALAAQASSPDLAPAPGPGARAESVAQMPAPPDVSAQPAGSALEPARTPKATPSRRGRATRSRVERAPATAEIAVPLTNPTPAAGDQPTTDHTMPAPPAVAVPAVAVPATFVPDIETLKVNGALPVADVRRALERVRKTFAGCTSTRPERGRITFVIGEGRRPENVRASKASSAMHCVSAAFANARTENGPDVGNANVIIDVIFSARP